MYPVKLASRLWFIIQEWWVHPFFPPLHFWWKTKEKITGKAQRDTLIWWEDKTTINFLANLFLILTLTQKETEQQLAPVATSKLDAGVLQMYGFGEKKKKDYTESHSAFWLGGSGQFSQDGADSHVIRIRTAKKKIYRVN